MKPSVILMMMVAVIFAASQSQRNLLNLICEEAENLLSNLSKSELEETNLTVASAQGENQKKKCWKGFFCRAEKSLNATHLPKLNRLTRLIERYNKNHSVPCDVVNVTDTLEKFLKDVEECTLVFKRSKCVPKKQHEKA